MMDPSATLLAARTEIVDEAMSSLQSSHQVHYESAGDLFTRQRLEDLYDLVVTAIRDRDLSPVTAYAGQVADERFNAGFDVSEVQTAFNALETAMWRRIISAEPPESLAESIGLVGTVFGQAKDALARAYVSLAAHRHVTSLDLSALFRGTNS